MLETMKTIIRDYQEAVFETGFPRHLDLQTLPGKASVCIGVRRGGKSTYMYQLMDKLQKKGASRENILYLNFFDDRLRFLNKENLHLVTDTYFQLYPEKKNNETVYCFFDEIQAVDGWESFVDRLMRTENCEIYLTGSSAEMLSKEISTRMRGRALTWELFPYSFPEFLQNSGINPSDVVSSKKRAAVQNGFDTYWQQGAFPEVFGLQDRLRIKIHQEYFHAVLFRDLVERYDISHPRAVVDLAHQLIDNTASLYSVNSLTGYLKSLGHSVPKTSVSDYIAWFEDAYFMFSVELFDASVSRRKRNPRKIYCVDHSLVRSISSGILTNAGHLLENLVYTAIRRISPDIFYYKTGNGKEVDFIVKREKNSLILIQVCETLADPRTRKREVGALEAAMKEIELSSGILVTRNEEETINVEQGKISVQPAWRFLLEMED